MLTENEIIDIIISYYSNLGYSNTKKNYTNQKGIIDLVFQKDKNTVFVEAKGETSSKPNSSNFGNPFSSSQVRNHIANSIYQIFTVLKYKTEHTFFILAFPDNADHRNYLEPIKHVLKEININVLLIDKNKQINKYI